MNELIYFIRLFIYKSCVGNFYAIRDRCAYFVLAYKMLFIAL